MTTLVGSQDPNPRSERALSSAPESDASSGCRHCGLPVPDPAPVAGFCCAGCATVYDLLRDSGLERFYDLGGGANQPVGQEPRAAAMPWLDELVAAGAQGDGSWRVDLDVQGVRCAACVWVLKELWQRVPGRVALDLDPSIGRLSLRWRAVADGGDEGVASVRRFLEGAARLGYPVAPPSAQRAPRDRSLMVRLGICASLAMNAMIIAIAVYAGLEAEGGLLAEVFGWVSAGLATAAVIAGGPVFLRGALQGVRQRVWHLDQPIALGIALAWAGSVWAFAEDQPTYFDTVTIFVALMVAGRFVQERAVARNRDRLLRDDGAEHLRVRREGENGLSLVPVRDVVAGDRLVLVPGDLVPVAAILDQERAAFSLDWISGEAEPRAFSRGERIPAGAFQGERRPVRALAAEPFEASHLRQLLRVPQGDPEDLGARGGFWRGVNRTYVVAVLVLAAAGLAAWWGPAGPEKALSVAVSILVVTCPCALGLAVPLAFHLALARLRSRGVFVRTASLLEKARHVRKVAFDKTGTLTWGGLRVVDHEALGEPLDARERAVVRAMTAVSNHPASVAVCRWLDGEHPTSFGAELEVHEHVGSGLDARDRGSDAHYRIGRRDFAVAEPRGGGDAGSELRIWFSVDGAARASLRLTEDDRPGMQRELRTLASMGLEIHMLSGDRRQRAAAAAARLGIPPDRAHGGLSPEDKAARVAALDDDDTLMVGDGINDAPAFEAAFCTGTPALDRPVLPGRAGFFYTGAQPGAVAAVLETARRLHATGVTNLWLAGIYNVGALALCFAGAMTPLACAVLMPLSSLLLVGHTMVRLASVGTPGGDGWK